MVFVRDESKEILRSYIFALAKGSSTPARRKEWNQHFQPGAGDGAVKGHGGIESAATFYVGPMVRPCPSCGA
jgi:hypothetical protein